ncbi:MAG: hypothetical protein ABSH14_16230 [Verrucomicrobiia bacterium]|jgi:hypothetical protein
MPKSDSIQTVYVTGGYHNLKVCEIAKLERSVVGKSAEIVTEPTNDNRIKTMQAVKLQ